jgi:hypothetical protein
MCLFVKGKCVLDDSYSEGKERYLVLGAASYKA